MPPARTVNVRNIKQGILGLSLLCLAAAASGCAERNLRGNWSAVALTEGPSCSFPRCLLPATAHGAALGSIFLPFTAKDPENSNAEMPALLSTEAGRIDIQACTADGGCELGQLRTAIEQKLAEMRYEISFYVKYPQALVIQTRLRRVVDMFKNPSDRCLYESSDIRSCVDNLDIFLLYFRPHCFRMEQLTIVFSSNGYVPVPLTTFQPSDLSRSTKSLEERQLTKIIKEPRRALFEKVTYEFCSNSNYGYLVDLSNIR